MQPQNNQTSNVAASLGEDKSGSRVESVTAPTTILVALANYGQRNDVHLQRLLREFRSMRWRLDVHVLTNQPKDLGPDVTVHVGLPTRNPRSLPFAHRRLFAERLSQADYFIYCEDDTLITERNINAFLEVNALLGPDEIPGFLRIEQLSPSELHMESAHGPYRWNPASVVRRGSHLFAAFTNVHSAATIASRAQIQKAIDSGGFLVPPHVGRFGMLECAASDLYTQCGFNRLICISRIEEFLLPHLSNANSLKWGLQYEEFLAQTSALERVAQTQGWTGSLVEIEAHVPRGFWSKNLYENPDQSFLSNFPSTAKTVLSIGAGWGATEDALAAQGKQVVAVPVDAVFADCLRRRKIEVVEGNLEAAVAKLRPRQFDGILLRDILHLSPDPVQWLKVVESFLAPGGTVVASLPRTMDPLRAVWFLRGEPDYVFPAPFRHSNVQRVTRSRLTNWFRQAGLTARVISSCTSENRAAFLKKTHGIGFSLLADHFTVLARRRG